MRLDKILAHSGYGTRKQVRQLIKSKVVEVDGQTVTSYSMHVNPQAQIVAVNGSKVNYEKYIYMMLHKPQDVISATVDRVEDTVIDLVPDEYSHIDLAPVGRLDKDTEGLILLTNDGKLNHLLTSPKTNIWKTYEAIINGEVTDEHISLFSQGVTLDDGYVTKPAQLKIIKSGTKSVVELAITEGKFHQVKRMFRSIGMNVEYLKRTKIGEIQLDESLAKGESRLLNKSELAWLMNVKRGDEGGSIN